MSPQAGLTGTNGHNEAEVGAVEVLAIPLNANLESVDGNNDETAVPGNLDDGGESGEDDDEEQSEGPESAEESEEEEFDSDDSEVESDPEVDSEDIKERLESHLTEIQGTGQIAFYEDLKDMPNPGVFFPGKELLGFPLTSHHINFIKRNGVQEPVLPVVAGVAPQRNQVWTVDGSLLQIINPAWHERRKSILERLKTMMGITHEISANLSTLILYGRGSTIVAPANNQVGTLDFILPSTRDPSNLIVSYGGRQQSFSTASRSTFDTSVLAWFSDATCTREAPFKHDIAVLRYSLVSSGSGIVCSAARIEQRLSGLCSILTSWEKQSEEMSQKYMGFLLDRDYKDQDLSHQKLQGKDHLVISQLAEACVDTGFYVCLANIKRTVEGCSEAPAGDDSDPPFMDDVWSNSTEVTRVVALNGQQPYNGFSFTFDDDSFIQSEPFKDAEPDGLYHDAHHGNLEHYFFRSIALIMPQKLRLPFFFGDQAENRVRVILTGYCFNQQLQMANPNPDAFLDAKDACRFVLQDSTWDSPAVKFGQSVVELVLTAIARIKDRQLVKLALPIAFSEGGYFRYLEPLLLPAKKRWLYQKLTHQLSKSYFFHERCNRVERMNLRLLDPVWASTRYDLAVINTPLKVQKDADRLLKMARSHHGDGFLEYWNSVLLPALKRSAESPTVVMSFYEGMRNSTLIADSFPAMAFQTASVMTIERNNTFLLNYSVGEEHSIHFASIVKVLEFVRSQGKEELVEQFCVRSQEFVNKANQGKLEGIYPFFLQKLHPLSTLDPIKDLYRSILNAMVSKCVPPRPANWIHRRLGCGGRGCQQCTSVDNFLIDPGVYQFNRRMSILNMNHIMQRLSTDVKTGTLAVQAHRVPSPHLIITKIRKDYEQKMEAYKAKIAKLREQYLNLGEQRLMTILGAQDYAKLTLLQPLPPRAPRGAAPVASVARPVVDLTKNGDHDGQSNQSTFIDLTADDDDEESDGPYIAAVPQPSGVASSSASNGVSPTPKRTAVEQPDVENTAPGDQHRNKRTRPESSSSGPA